MKKTVLIVFGSLALILGLIGVVLPGLPTTPFILLAAYCFAQASPALHQRLLNNRYFGKMIRDWETDRSLSRRTKTFALASMVLMLIISLLSLSEKPVLQGVILLLGIIGTVVVWRIPTRPT